MIKVRKMSFLKNFTKWKKRKRSWFSPWISTSSKSIVKRSHKIEKTFNKNPKGYLMKKRTKSSRLQISTRSYSKSFPRKKGKSQRVMRKIVNVKNVLMLTKSTTMKSKPRSKWFKQIKENKKVNTGTQLKSSMVCILGKTSFPKRVLKRNLN
jgi:hypothetical protein